jgi:hypothetical protein
MREQDILMVLRIIKNDTILRYATNNDESIS